MLFLFPRLSRNLQIIGFQDFIYSLMYFMFKHDTVRLIIFSKSSHINLLLNKKSRYISFKFIQMSQVSEFTINQKIDPQTQSYSCTPQPFHSRDKEIQLPTTTNVSIFKESNYKCTQCADHLSSLTQAKKHQILLEYQVEKLKQEIDKLKRQNQHLIQIQYTHHKANLQKYNPLMYFKEDLESELYEAKYLLQLHILSKSNDLPHIKPSSIKQSKKQKQFIELMSKPIDLKKKCEQLLLQNIKLQQKNMIKDKIIEERSLFPLYHYDQRILTLRKAVQFWYRKAEHQTAKLVEVMNDVKRVQKDLKKQTKIMIQQERILLQAQIKNVLHLFNQSSNTFQSNSSQFYRASKESVSKPYESFKNSQNQDHQKRDLYKTQRNNILIEDDHTILSICQKMNETKTKDKVKQTKRKSVAVVNPNLCESCIMDERNKSKSMKGAKSAKNSAKDEAKQEQHSKNDSKLQQIKKKATKKDNQFRSNYQGANNSLMGKNFQNIEIKLRQKQKWEDNHNPKKGAANSSPKLPLRHVRCQRCAERNV